MARSGTKAKAGDARWAPRAPAANADGAWLFVRGARQNNLKNIDAGFPLGRFICVSGVSGSGKSSLVNEILYEALARDLNGATTATPGAHDRIDGTEHLDKIIAIDQTPIGRTPRSNPATYIKVFDLIRDLFARLPDAKVRGYKPGRFSFNVAARAGGGRCEACEGNGANRIAMDFLADVWVTCPICDGKRFSRETLQILYQHRSISDVLEMDVQQARAHFDNLPRIAEMLQTLIDVGLDYVKLGQASTTLSGGEAQRIKLARELVKRSTGRTIYVLDEPTTGLHFDDVRRLLAVLHGFVDAGNTVVVIEHNLDVLKTADWLLDLGPEGGEGGGRLLAQGTPEQVAEVEASYTGQALREVLAPGAAPPTRKAAGRAAARDAGRPDPQQWLSVRGAQQHNLRDVSVSIPRDRMTVCTGVSGSGKTSFAVDTVFTEGYRRYVESLSAYARQFLGQLNKPRVDHIEGLSPAICIEQRSAGKSPRSTVGTVTEIYDYMRVMWARIGQPHCTRCQAPIGSQTVDEIVARILALDAGTPIIVLAPIGLSDGESWGGVLTRLKNSGYLRVRIDGQVQKTAEATTLDARRRHRVEVVIDRTTVKAAARGRIAEAVEHAVMLGNGVMTLLVEPVETVEDEADSAGGGAAPRATQTRRSPEREILFSQKLACLKCGASYEELSPHHFSFNSHTGWCETCEGLGVQRGAPPASILKNPGKSIFGGAVAGWPSVDKRSPFGRMLAAVCAQIGVEPDAPLRDWTPEQRRFLLFGDPSWIDGREPLGVSRVGAGLRFQWRGFFPTIDDATRNSWVLRHQLHNVVTDVPCMSCRGGRLRPDAAAVRVGDRTIVEVCELPLEAALAFFDGVSLERGERKIAGEVLAEIRTRLRFLVDVGLEYLHLHRAAPTLSGGESQRIRLASQIGGGLSGVLYVLDEPTIGLHPRDTQRLVRALHRLRDLGNTLLLVEHDRDVVRSADHLLDFGPGAGIHGGRIVAQGTPQAVASAGSNGKRRRGASEGAEAEPASLTGAYLGGGAVIPVPANRRAVDPDGWRDLPERGARRKGRGRGKAAGKKRPGAGRFRTFALDPQRPDDPVRDWLLIRGARQNNLRNIDVPIPLGRFVCISGVSGSGKSSLVDDILWPALAGRIQGAQLSPGEHDEILGIEALDQVINVDQSPIGATPSSNPATYTGAFDLIRELFTRLPESKVRGYEAKQFSFNRPGGRCEACEGYGQKRVEMHFMPDVWVECEMCRGKRYNADTLEIRYKGKSIADVLEMSAAAALELFSNVPRLRRVLQTLVDVGLGYVQLGQPAPTLSGGEAQRVKLAAELARPQTGRTLYLLDEPTTGLHFDDVRKLLEIMHRLVDLGNSVVVVEHNLDVLKSADWIIELGPEAGAGGGELIGVGTPERIAGLEKGAPSPTHTGAALRPLLESEPREMRPRFDALAHAAAVLAAEKGGYGEVGREVKMPWLVDGRKWHLEQRTDRQGRQTRWEPAALEYVIDLVQSAGTFAETNWSNRASIEITAEDAPTWFLHALTGGEWLLELYFRVPPGTFDAAKLNRQIGLKTLDEREDLETYGNWPRVDVRIRADGFDAVVVYPHDKAEIDTPAFRKFVAAAARAYFAGIDR